jgi:putative oxidoreductase
MKAVFVLGRAIFGGFFLYNGINHILHPEALTQYARAKGVPSPKLGVIASGALQTLGGASIITGWKPKLGAAALLAFLASVSPKIHDFWNAQEANTRQNEMIHFSKNLALLGAALALMSLEEPWPASVGEL